MTHFIKEAAVTRSQYIFMYHVRVTVARYRQVRRSSGTPPAELDTKV